ncbi:MAG: dTDP-4-dehydrorhamnose reductase [Clostridia bacterium]|nr:dTDP-4-dehydrorhamnose reductase [Clostridia bacterium]
MILVTGAKGQVGSDVCALLKQQNRPFLGVDVDTLDLTDEESVRAFFGAHQSITAVIHCAAYTAVDKAEDDFEACARVNVTGTTYLAEACGSGIELLYLSSDYVFGSDGGEPLETDDPKTPRGVYAKSKYAGELAVELLSPKHYIVRTSWVFGEQNRNFIATILRLADTHDTLRVVADQIGAPTYSRHLAKLLCSMIESGKYGVYHATNEGECSWYELAQYALQTQNKAVTVLPVTTEEYAAKAPRPKNSRLSKHSLDEAGFSRLPNWKDAVKEYLSRRKEQIQ